MALPAGPAATLPPGLPPPGRPGGPPPGRPARPPPGRLGGPPPGRSGKPPPSGGRPPIGRPPIGGPPIGGPPIGGPPIGGPPGGGPGGPWANASDAAAATVRRPTKVNFRCFIAFSFLSWRDGLIHLGLYHAGGWLEGKLGAPDSGQGLSHCGLRKVDFLDRIRL